MRSAVALSVVLVASVLLGLTGGVATISESAARESRERHSLMGMVCAVVGKDGLREIGASGVRRRASTDPLQVGDRMHLGSCTKALTATLAAAMVADGSLRWDSTVGEVLGKAVPAINDQWRAVTLEQLLRHRGGASAEAHPADWRAATICKGTPRECRAAFVVAMLARKPAEAIGTYVYSNQGYAIAGHMLETVATEGFEALLTRRVLAPLAIAHAGFGPPSRADPESPKGHTEVGMPLDIDNPSAIAPAGTLHMPVGEWAKFIAFHLGATPPSALEGAAKQLAKLHEASPDAPHEALGWLTGNRDWGGAVLTHAGSNTKWYCVAWLAPEKGFAVLAAVNQGGPHAQQACDEACAQMIRALQQPPAKPADAVAPAK